MAKLIKDQVPSQVIVGIVLFVFELLQLDSLSVKVYYYSNGKCQLEVVVDE